MEREEESCVIEAAIYSTIKYNKVANCRIELNWLNSKGVIVVYVNSGRRRQGVLKLVAREVRYRP